MHTYDRVGEAQQATALTFRRQVDAMVRLVEEQADDRLLAVFNHPAPSRDEPVEAFGRGLYRRTVDGIDAIAKRVPVVSRMNDPEILDAIVEYWFRCSAKQRAAAIAQLGQPESTAAK
ncbi:MAG: hypothetical protein AAGI54_00640 [Planctomycetota bacterium]